MSKNIKNDIIDFYISNFNQPIELIDLMLNMAILTYTATGISIDQIVSLTGLEQDEIISVNLRYFSFEGWKYPLDMNPLLWYNSGKQDFFKRMKHFTDHDIANKAFMVVKLYSYYNYILEDRWK